MRARPAPLWKLGFTTGMAQRPLERTTPTGDILRLEGARMQAKRRFRAPDDVEVLTCYEAGRDGFWVHRLLEAIGHRSYVVDAMSTEVNRRARPARTHLLAMVGLLRLLVRCQGGERSLERRPGPEREAEGARHLHRELLTLKRGRARLTNRIRVVA